MVVVRTATSSPAAGFSSWYPILPLLEAAELAAAELEGAGAADDELSEDTSELAAAELEEAGAAEDELSEEAAEEEAGEEPEHAANRQSSPAAKSKGKANFFLFINEIPSKDLSRLFYNRIASESSKDGQIYNLIIFNQRITISGSAYR